MAMRAAIIRQTAESFRPDLFLVDKEPLGLRGEVLPTLKLLQARGTTLALGLRDIMDDPKFLAAEWKRKKVLPALGDCTTRSGSTASPGSPIRLKGTLSGKRSNKMIYTGYLWRSAAAPGAGAAARQSVCPGDRRRRRRRYGSDRLGAACMRPIPAFRTMPIVTDRSRRTTSSASSASAPSGSGAWRSCGSTLTSSS